jgi:hypothetical protein
MRSVKLASVFALTPKHDGWCKSNAYLRSLCGHDDDLDDLCGGERQEHPLLVPQLRRRRPTVPLYAQGVNMYIDCGCNLMFDCRRERMHGHIVAARADVYVPLIPEGPSRLAARPRSGCTYTADQAGWLAACFLWPLVRTRGKPPHTCA